MTALGSIQLRRGQKLCF